MRRRRGEPAASRPPSVVAATAAFAAAGLLATAIVGVGGAWTLQRLGNREAVLDARRMTQTITHGVIWPNLEDGIVTGDAQAVARLDAIVRKAVLDDQVVRVKLWTPDGRVLYSDQTELIGQRFPDDGDLAAVVADRETKAEITDAAGPENVFERDLGKLLEVYAPVATPSRERLVFEMYMHYDSVLADGRSIWRTMAPALLGALVVLQVLQLPLALHLARRVRDGHRQRERLLTQAVEAQDAERRRIAHDLHDGVVQELAGLSFALQAAGERVAGGSGTAGAGGGVGGVGGVSAGDGSADRAEAARVLREAAASTRGGVRQLRSLLVDLYPPSLHEAGLGPALSDLLAPLADRGITATLAVPDDLPVAPATEALIYRATRESLRNVVAHAAAQRVDVRLATVNGHVELRVEDDGVGFELPSPTAPPNGHLGLRLLADLAREAGGSLAVDSAPGAGTRVVLAVPR
jgi:two-component system, NarL family, sensor kinase